MPRLDTLGLVHSQSDIETGNAPRVSKLLHRVTDVTERAFVIALSLPFLWAFWRALPTHPNAILTAASEMLAVIFILTRKRGTMALTAVPVLVGLAGTSFPLLIRPGGAQLLPTWICSILMAGGLALSALSKIYLNRSFGLVAANRGVKMRGPYRLVRHPMYLGYFVNQVGFLLANFTAPNFLLYFVAWSLQIIRVREEERFLLQDQEYRRFAERVPTRLVPGIY